MRLKALTLSDFIMTISIQILDMIVKLGHYRHLMNGL